MGDNPKANGVDEPIAEDFVRPVRDIIKFWYVTKLSGFLNKTYEQVLNAK